MNNRNRNIEKTQEKRVCFFCANNIEEFDYRNIPLIRRFINQRGKIIAPRRTGACGKHQRKVATAIKRARTMAMLSPTGK